MSKKTGEKLSGGVDSKQKRKRPGGVVKHGAYSLISGGDSLPYWRKKYISDHLKEVREGLIEDHGGEANLTTAEKVLIDRVISKLGIIRLLEEWAKEEGIFKDGKLEDALGSNFLAYCNSMRHDLNLLGVDSKTVREITVQDYIEMRKDSKNEG